MKLATGQEAGKWVTQNSNPGLLTSKGHALGFQRWPVWLFYSKLSETHRELQTGLDKRTLFVYRIQEGLSDEPLEGQEEH